MIEYEGKILEVDRDMVLSKIPFTEYELVSCGNIHAIYYDTLDRSLNKSGRMLRCRRVENLLDDTEKIEMTLKIWEGSFREEKTIYVKRTAEYPTGGITSFLFGLGFDIVKSINKYRESYRMKISDERAVLLEFDKVEGCPMWLEVEAETEKELKVGVERLGYNFEDLSYESMGDLIKKYRGEKDE